MNSTVGKYRWRIVALLFFATAINYIDRQVLSLVATDEGFIHDLGLADADGKLNKELFGYLDAAFKGAYALGFLIMGSVLDKFGSRKGFSFAIVLWSVSAAGHALAKSISGLGIGRFFLGLGEAANYPACVKTVAEWFPKKERSFATGLFNAGSNIGAILAPILVPFLVINYGWQSAFVVTGAFGFIWLFFWLITYKKPAEHPKVSKEELAYICSDEEVEPAKKISWIKLLSYKQTWSFALGKMLTDPVWYLFLTWLPTFFKEEHKVDLKTMFIPMIVIYLVSDGGSILGGWFSSHLIKKGWTINKARKLTMLICALAVTPIFFASMTSNISVAIGLISLAAAAHQAWSANLFTTVSDSFPKSAVASVVGIGSMMGSLMGMFVAAITGLVYQKYGPIPLFVVASCAYLPALLLVNVFNKNLEPVVV